MTADPLRERVLACQTGAGAMVVEEILALIRQERARVLEEAAAALPNEIDERVEADEQMNYDLRRFRRLLQARAREERKG